MRKFAVIMLLATIFAVPLSLSTPTTALAASVSVEPTAGPPGTEFWFAGEGFTSSFEVDVWWDGVDFLGTLTTDDEGNFGVWINSLETDSFGVHFVEFYDVEMQLTSTAYFELTYEATTCAPDANEGYWDVNPNEGYPGDQTTIFGDGYWYRTWYEGETLEVYFEDSSGRREYLGWAEVGCEDDRPWLEVGATVPTWASAGEGAFWILSEPGVTSLGDTSTVSSLRTMNAVPAESHDTGMLVESTSPLHLREATLQQADYQWSWMPYTVIDAPAPVPTPTPPPTPTPIPEPDTYSISGTVYEDVNENGVQDAGESGYQSATVNLIGSSTTSADTNSSGRYSFPQVQAGTYTVSLEVPSGYSATTTNPVDVPVSANTIRNFGIVGPPPDDPSPAPPTGSDGFRLPWDKNLDPQLHFTGGPHDSYDDAYSGIDFSLANPGIHILAMDGGTVVDIYREGDESHTWCEKDGVLVSCNIVWIEHDNGWVVGYVHLASIQVSKGQRVEQGQWIGIQGSSGATNIHIHLELQTADREYESWDGKVIDGWTVRSEGGNHNGYMSKAGQKIYASAKHSQPVQSTNCQWPCASSQVSAQVLSAFEGTWSHTDQVVADGTANRTWMWGDAVTPDPISETYIDGTNLAAALTYPTGDGYRWVTYHDKSRMEVTNPSGDPNLLWYVTNGLLATELVTGRLQLGDDAFVSHAPAQVNVAGDADDPTGPTYATFNVLMGYQPFPVGNTLTQRVDRDSATLDDSSLAQYGVTAAYLDDVTNHTIAAPFWEFMNSSGLIYEDGQYKEGPLFPNPFYATGRPITEAYWANVKVAGTYKDVLMQCFERRCLTYTPDNPDGWKVEAGNVGQHYYTWRYEQIPNEDPTPNPPEEAPPSTDPPSPSPTPTPTPSPTPSPTPTATPTPSPSPPQSGEVLFSDPNLETWSEFEGDHGGASREDSVYQMWAVSDGDYASSWNRSEDFGNVLFSADLRLLDGGSASEGCIYVRKDDASRTGRAYMFCVLGNGEVAAYYVYQHFGGNLDYDTLLEPTSDHLNDIESWNTLGISADGQQLTFFVNGHEVGDERDSRLGTDQIGIGVFVKSGDDDGARFAFRNALVQVP